MLNPLLAGVLLLLNSGYVANVQIQSVRQEGNLVTLNATAENFSPAVRVVTIGFPDPKAPITQTVVLQPGQKKAIRVSRTFEGSPSTVNLGYLVQGECKWTLIKDHPIKIGK